MGVVVVASLRCKSDPLRAIEVQRHRAWCPLPADTFPCRAGRRRLRYDSLFLYETHLYDAMGCICGRRRIEDSWEFDKKLGQGAFATVWRATSKLKNGAAGAEGAVAVKAIDKRMMKQNRLTAAHVKNEVGFMRECKGQKTIVQLHDFLDTRITYYLVLELCDGGDLEQATATEEGRSIPDRQQAYLLKQVLEGIQFMHSKRICHRDIKPQNTMMVGHISNSQALVKLCDFGIARRIKDGELATEKVGTPAFMAPELHLLPSKSKGYGLKVDMWATGVLAVFLMANAYAFVDSAGRLMREQLLDGKIPVWDASGFAGLFQRAREVVGLAKKRPSKAAQELVRALLNPTEGSRLTAEDALNQAWFNTESADGEDDGRPLLLTEAFGGLVSGVRDSVAGGVGTVVDSAADAVASVGVEVGDFAPGRAQDCMVCSQPAGELSHQCPGCRNAICMSCLGKLPTRSCPKCQHPVGGDVAVTAAVVNGLAGISAALGFQKAQAAPANAESDAAAAAV